MAAAVAGKKDKDTTPPAAVDTLLVLSVTSSTIELGWVAVADDDDSGDAAAVYDVRYSTSLITDANFDSASTVICDPVPEGSGSPETTTVGDLSEQTEYWLALKVRDDAGNWSDLSNVVSAETKVTPSAEFALEVVDPLAGPNLTGSLDLAYDLSDKPKPSIAYKNLQSNPISVPVRFASWNGTGWDIELIENLFGSGVDLAYDPTSGQATVSYGFRSSTKNATYTLNFARRIEPNDWSIEIVDDTFDGYGYKSLAYDPSGKPSISYRLWKYSKTKNPGLKFAYWDGSSWIVEMVDPGVDTRNNIGNSLAYDPATKEAAIAYLRSETLKFFRRDAETGTWSSQLVKNVSAHPDWAGGVSLVYDPVSENPSIAFTAVSSDSSGDDMLKFARWDGSTWVIETVETCAGCGEGKSLAYAADGTAYISYANYDTRQVKLARRNGPNDWMIETVTGCVAASPTSLKFDPNGNPSIAYSDYVNDKLKFARVAP